MRSSAGIIDRSSNLTAKPSRIALPNRGESESATTSSRRIRCIASVNGTDSAGIRSGRASSEARYITILTPRSIAIIFKQWSCGNDVLGPLKLMNAQVDGQRIVNFHTERRTAFRNVDIARFNGYIPVFRFVRNGSPNFFRGFPLAGSEPHFLIHGILELK